MTIVGVARVVVRKTNPCSKESLVVCISISFWPISYDFENGCTCALWAKRNVAKAEEEHHQETLQRGGGYYYLLANSQISSEIIHCRTKVRNL
ncbi:hypothetical protein HanXRQr2_Chr10g0432161 [Helianthus annuus]|uniref:Uncharacterized protein n=1 Tax=Helianthus annuus TaxID=4232 RepID=A0A9K3N3L4_HELAN|nr:hypothetical protein HanXRQr2_Chr10g0432161 [Helianthus annuus]